MGNHQKTICVDKMPLLEYNADVGPIPFIVAEVGPAYPASLWGGSSQTDKTPPGSEP